MNKLKIISASLALVCYLGVNNASHAALTLAQVQKNTESNKKKANINTEFQTAYDAITLQTDSLNAAVTQDLNNNPQKVSQVNAAIDRKAITTTTTIKSPLSGFSYALGFAVDFNNSSGAVKFSYGLSKAKFHSAELLYKVNNNFILGYAFIYGSGDNKSTIKNQNDIGNTNVDIKNKQELLSGMLNAYYQIPLSQYLSSNVGIGLGLAGHTQKLDITRSGVKASYKDHYNSFAYRASLGGKLSLGNASSIDLSYNMNGFGSKKRSTQLLDSYDIIEVKKSNINHEIVLGFRVSL